MNNSIKQINMEELAPVIIETVTNGGVFRLYPKGESMLPTIKETEDSVILVKPEELNKYDVVLYRRDDGKYVLHRIVRVNKDNSFDMCGDNQYIFEKNVSRCNILAKVQTIYKKDVAVCACDKKHLTNIKFLYLKKLPKRLFYAFKRMIYPLYKALFK